MPTWTHARGEKKLMTKKWSDANTRKGRRYATPQLQGVYLRSVRPFFAPLGGVSVYYFPLSLMIDQHRFFSLTLPHSLPTPPLKSPLLSSIKICPSISTDLSHRLTLQKLTKILFPELYQWKIIISFAQGLTTEVYISSIPSACCSRTQPSAGSLYQESLP